eukprot:SAG31_NODE_7563_length_1653_cov_1.278636_1_plen_93_part_00
MTHQIDVPRSHACWDWITMHLTAVSITLSQVHRAVLQPSLSCGTEAATVDGVAERASCGVGAVRVPKEPAHVTLRASSDELCCVCVASFRMQ